MKYQQIVFPAPERAVLEDREDSRPLEGHEIAGKTIASIISAGTELNQFLGHYADAGIDFGRFPATPGYGCVFRIEEIGPEVSRFRPGELAFTMGPHASWQRRVEKETLPLPPQLDPREAVFARIMNITLSAMTQTAARPPEPVLVMGLGPVGMLGALAFQACGYRVAGIDLATARRETAAKQGLALVAEDAKEAIALLGEKAALGLDCTGHEAAVLDACRHVRAGGEVVIVGVPLVQRTDLPAQALLDAVFRSRIALRSGTEWIVPRHPEPYRHNTIFGNLAAGLRWIAEGRVSVSGLAEIRRPDSPQALYDDVRAQRLQGLAIVLDWS